MNLIIIAPGPKEVSKFVSNNWKTLLKESFYLVHVFGLYFIYCYIID